MYDRGKRRPPLLKPPGLQYRLETLLGMTGYKLAKYRESWWEASMACLNLVWRPQFISVVIFEVPRPCLGRYLEVLTMLWCVGGSFWF